jgi:hypothetical protein
LVQHCPSRVPCAMSLPHSGLSLCGRRPTSSGTYHFPGPFPRLSAAPYGYIPVPMPLLQRSESFHCGLFLRDLLIHCYGLLFSWIFLHIF